MTDRKPDALVPSADAGRGALTQQPAGDLVARGLADLQKLKATTPSPQECYERGQEFYWDQPPNYAEALGWYRQAAEQGHALGLGNLGVMYHNGSGVSHDVAEAYFWYLLAVSETVGSPDQRLIGKRDRAADRLTPEQREAAESRATAWRLRRQESQSPVPGTRRLGSSSP